MIVDPVSMVFMGSLVTGVGASVSSLELAPFEFVHLGDVDALATDSWVLLGSVELLFFRVVLPGNGMEVGLAGHVQEQLQQSLFKRDDFDTGRPGYQFWKVRGSPLAQLLHDMFCMLVEKFFRRPIQ